MPLASESAATADDPPWDQIIVVASPKAGSGSGGERLSQYQKRMQVQRVDVVVCSEVKDYLDCLVRCHDAGKRVLVVAAGGDGTLNLVVSVSPKGVPVQPFPLGTENLVARHYGFVTHPQLAVEQAVMVTLRGRLQWIDAGHACFPRAGRVARRRGESSPGEGGGAVGAAEVNRLRERMFLVMASVGLDADVVRRMHLTRKGHISRWSYAKPIWQALRTYGYPPIRVEQADTGSWGEERMERPGAQNVQELGELSGQSPLTVAWALVFNLPRYAGGLKIEPAADETDGVFHFCGLERGSHWHGFRYLAGVLGGRHTSWPDVRRLVGKGFRISSGRPLAVQLDGDFAGRTPVELRVEPQRVLLRLPQQI